MSTSPSATDVCNGLYENLPVWTTTGNVQFGDVLYANSSGTILYTGYRNIYIFANCVVLTIDPSTATVNGFGLPCQNCV
jgi:hypothetical protein